MICTEEIVVQPILLRYLRLRHVFGEAGSAGRDTRGILRQHPNRSRLIALPPESGKLERLTGNAEAISKAWAPYRVMCLSTDMGLAKTRS